MFLSPAWLTFLRCFRRGRVLFPCAIRWRIVRLLPVEFHLLHHLDNSLNVLVYVDLCFIFRNFFLFRLLLFRVILMDGRVRFGRSAGTDGQQHDYE